MISMTKLSFSSYENRKYTVRVDRDQLRKLLFALEIWFCYGKLRKDSKKPMTTFEWTW